MKMLLELYLVLTNGWEFWEIQMFLSSSPPRSLPILPRSKLPLDLNKTPVPTKKKNTTATTIVLPKRCCKRRCIVPFVRTLRLGTKPALWLGFDPIVVIFVSCLAPVVAVVLDEDLLRLVDDDANIYNYRRQESILRLILPIRNTSKQQESIDRETPLSDT